VKPTFLTWLVTGLFLAVMIAVVVLSYFLVPHYGHYTMWVGQFVAALIALIALYLQSDQARK
jgi:uncharacterized membrane protein YoaK (UPF0700 family)